MRQQLYSFIFLECTDKITEAKTAYFLAQCVPGSIFFPHVKKNKDPGDEASRSRDWPIGFSAELRAQFHFTSSSYRCPCKRILVCCSRCIFCSLQKAWGHQEKGIQTTSLVPSPFSRVRDADIALASYVLVECKLARLFTSFIAERLVISRYTVFLGPCRVY